MENYGVTKYIQSSFEALSEKSTFLQRHQRETVTGCEQFLPREKEVHS